MGADIEQVCTTCGDRFWLTAREQEYADEVGVSVAAVHCPDCRRRTGSTKKRRSRKTSALVPSASAHSPDLVSQAMPDQAELMGNLRHWLEEAHTVYPVREKTFWERITLSDKPEVEESRRRRSAWDSVEGLLAEHQAMLTTFTKAQKQRIKAQTRMVVAQAEAETAMVRARTELLNAQLEQVMVQERFRRALSREANAEAKAALPTLQDLETLKEELQSAQLEERYRRRLREHADADQLAISEFLDQVRRVFNHPEYERVERASRIRSLMDSFEKGFEDLPPEVRRFLRREEEGDD